MVYVWPSKPKDAGSNPVARSKVSRQSPNANPVGDELTRLCRCSQYIVGAVPTGKANQVESKSHKVSAASLGSMARTYRSRSLYKQRGGKSPHNAFSKFSGIHIMVIISDCLSEDGSSILPCRASLVLRVW